MIFAILVSLIIIPSGAQALVLSDDDNSLRDNIIVNGTTTRYRYVEILNGWYGQPHIQASGGYIQYTSTLTKMGTSFKAPENMTVVRALTYVDGDFTPAADQMWKVSLQSNNPTTNLPSGTELASITDSARRDGLPCSGDCGSIQRWDFAAPYNITYGEKYWIVQEYVSGTSISSSATLAPVINVVYTPEGYTPEMNYVTTWSTRSDYIPIRNVFGIEEYSWKDPNYRLCTYSTGTWTCDNRQLLFAVESKEGKVYGSLSRHKFTSLRNTTSHVQAEQFKVIEQDVTVNQLTIGIRGNGNPPPNVDIKAEILEDDASTNKPNNRNVVWSDPVFVNHSKLWGVRGIDAMTLYSQYINPPLTLKKGKYYIVTLSTQGQTYGVAVMDMAGPRSPDANTEDPLYGARVSYEGQDARSYASWELTDTDWTNPDSGTRYKHDLPVPMKLADRYDGEFTTTSLNKGVGDKWTNISFNFETQTGTSIRAEYRVSDDNNIWSNWAYLNSANTLSSGAVYAIPAQDQKQYVQIRGHLYTTNPIYTPVLHSISLDAGAPSSPPETVPPAITSFSPANTNPSQDEGTTNTFTVTVDQSVISRWYLDSVQQSPTTTSYTKTWSSADAGTHTIVYTGDNADGSVSNTWTVTVNNIADITPPVITGASANPTASGATITWTTDEPSTSQVEYGTTTGYGSTTPLNSTLTTSHIAVISGLTNNTMYYYKVRSQNADGLQNVSRDYNFTTLQSGGVNGVVGFWQFDEWGGNTAGDSSGNGNTGTINLGSGGNTNRVNAGVNGKFGKALHFDGVDDYVQVSDSDTLEGMPQLTLEAWIYYQGGEGYARIVDKWKTGGGLYQLYKYSTTDNIGGYLSGILSSNVNTNVAFTNNSWQHMAMTYNGSAAVWYKDGMPIYTRAGLTGNIGTSTDPLYIGGTSNFNGTIDEVKVYNRALSAAEILAEYDAANRAYVNVTNYFYSDSSITYASAIDGKVAAGITALPVSGNVSVFANVFTNSLVNFSSDSSSGNQVTFNITNLKPNTNYRIKKDGAMFQAVQADSSGKITFINSAW